MDGNIIHLQKCKCGADPPNDLKACEQAQTFVNCDMAAEIILPDTLTTLANNVFSSRIATFLKLPSSVTSIGSNFWAPINAKYLDCTDHTTVPVCTANPLYVNGLPNDFEIRVPAALVDKWKAAQYWSSCAEYIVGV